MKQIVIFSYIENKGKFSREVYAVVYPVPNSIRTDVLDVLAEKLIKGFPDGTCYEIIDTPLAEQH